MVSITGSRRLIMLNCALVIGSIAISVVGCSTDIKPPSAGVYLKNPDGSFVMLTGYSLKESGEDALLALSHDNLPALHPSGTIAINNETLNSGEFYVCTNIMEVWHGIRELGSSVQLNHVEKETYVLYQEALKETFCPGEYCLVWLSSDQKTVKAWPFWYDDLSGISDFLGEWGQAKDYGFRRNSPVSGEMRGPLVVVEMRDCSLRVGTSFLSSYPASFSDGRVSVSWDIEPEPVTLVLTIDLTTHELIAPEGIPFIEGNSIRLRPYDRSNDNDTESAVTREAKKEMERQMK